MADTETIHREGPTVPDETRDVPSPTAGDVVGLAAGSERMLEYDMLQAQVEDGKYDGDGPADVAPVDQTV